MFDELCRTGRTHELATIHRFHHRWEAAASLQLRSGDPAAFDAYVDHGRVAPAPSTLSPTDAAGRGWPPIDAGDTIAIVAATNEHVDAINATIQSPRQRR